MKRIQALLGSLLLLLLFACTQEGAEPQEVAAIPPCEVSLTPRGTVRLAVGDSIRVVARSACRGMEPHFLPWNRIQPEVAEVAIRSDNQWIVRGAQAGRAYLRVWHPVFENPEALETLVIEVVPATGGR